MIDISSLISSLITEEANVWPMSIRGEADDDGSCLFQSMALLLKGDEISTTCRCVCSLELESIQRKC
jgi:hypothetical protein